MMREAVKSAVVDLVPAALGLLAGSPGIPEAIDRCRNDPSLAAVEIARTAAYAQGRNGVPLLVGALASAVYDALLCENIGNLGGADAYLMEADGYMKRAEADA